MTHSTHRFSCLIRTASMAGAIVFASMLPAQTPAAYFPLEIGNSWLYSPVVTNRTFGSSQEFRSVSVHGKETVAGREYFNVLYFGREILLRAEPSDNSLVLFDRPSGSEKPWLSLALPVGATFPTVLDQCSTTGTIASRDASVTTPAGAFANVVDVRFRGNCADAGVTQQFYAPGVGLVSTEETTFAGPLKFELAYYRAGSGTGSGQSVSFTVALDSPRYSVGGTLQARLTLRSSSADPIPLHFPSGQSFDLRIADANGKVGDLWSKDKLFLQMVRDETFGPGERTYGLSMSLAGLPPGRYTAEGYLTTNPVMYSGVVSFEIGTQGIELRAVNPPGHRHGRRP